MSERKLNHEIPENLRDGTFGRVLSHALRVGLGRSKSNNKRKVWNNRDLIDAIGVSERTIRCWKNDEVLISDNYFDTLMDVLLESERCYDEWLVLFQESRTKTYELINESKKDEGYTHREESSLREVHASNYENSLAGLYENSFSPDVYFNKLFNLFENDSHSKPIIIGPSYLDITITPVYTSILEANVEHSNVRKPKMEIGGSAVFAGRYLFSEFGIKSDFMTVKPIGRDPFSRTLGLEYMSEEWIDTLHGIESALPPSMTFILDQINDNTSTMFTCKSNKEAFSWDNIYKSFEIDKMERIFHISGFMKTELHNNLDRYFEILSRKNIIVFESGRFSPNHKEVDHQGEIKKAIHLGYIDIHITSIADFFDLHDIDKSSESDFSFDNLPSIIKDIIIKRRKDICDVTFIRDYDYHAGQFICILVYLGEIINLMNEISKPPRRPREYVYSSNRFNSALLYSIITNKIGDKTDFRSYFIQSGVSSLHKLIS